MSSKFLLSAGILLAVACQKRNFTAGSDTASGTTGIQNIRANHCEAFIDKTAISEKIDPTTGGGKTQSLFLFIKVNTERLDSPVRRVGYYGESTHDHRYGGTRSDFRESDLVSQDNALDYFRINLNLVKLYTYAGSNSKEVYRHSGAFFVQTEKGTRYWVNAKEKDNFDFNMDFFKGGAIPELRILTTFEPSTNEVASLKKTRDMGDIGQFFNPNGCK